jgi:hypothetical protein
MRLEMPRPMPNAGLSIMLSPAEQAQLWQWEYAHGVGNFGTHKEPHVQAWLKENSRFVYHFVTTSSSWLNLVEHYFRELTDKAVRRGSFVSVPDLHAGDRRVPKSLQRKSQALHLGGNG